MAAKICYRCHITKKNWKIICIAGYSYAVILCVFCGSQKIVLGEICAMLYKSISMYYDLKKIYKILENICIALYFISMK